MRVREWISEHLIDHKATGRAGRYVVQCLIATAAVVGLLLVLDVLRQTVIVSSLGATAFIVFTQPHSHASRARSLVGGYLVGMLVGLLFAGLRGLLLLLLANRHELVIAGVTGALAVGLCMLIMVFTNSEHPPAAGLALGVVINEWDLATLAVVTAGVAILYGLKLSLRSFLIDLR